MSLFALSLVKGCRQRGESFGRLSFDRLRTIGDTVYWPSELYWFRTSGCKSSCLALSI